MYDVILMSKEYNEMTDTELVKELTKMTQVLHNKAYFEFREGGEYERENLEGDYLFLKKRFDALQTEVVEEVELCPTDNFHDLWMQLWRMQIVEQDDVGELYCLAVASQIFRHIKIRRGMTEDDLRIHPCVIMPTGTGKSEGNTFVAQFCNRCNAVDLTAALPEEFSNATMIGTMNKSIIASNLALKVPEGHKDWRNPEREGLLKNTNFILFDEGENILKPSQRTEGIQRILQHAMNRHGSATNTVTNDLVDGVVSCNPNCCIFITGYYQDEFKNTLLDRGLLQRMVIIIKDSSDIDRYKIEKHIMGSIREVDNDEDVERAMQSTYDDICEVNALYNRLNKTVGNLNIRHESTEYVFMKKGVTAKIEEYKNLIREIVPNMTTYQNEVWETMVSRLTPSFIKVAAIYALLDGRRYIEEKDVTKAYKILMQSMQSIASFVMSKISSTQTSDATSGMYNRLVGIPKFKRAKLTREQWIDGLIVTFGMSPSKAEKLIRDLILTQKLLIKKELGKPNEKFLQLA